MFLDSSICACVCMHVCVPMCVCMYARVCVCMWSQFALLVTCVFIFMFGSYLWIFWDEVTTQLFSCLIFVLDFCHLFNQFLRLNFMFFMQTLYQLDVINVFPVTCIAILTMMPPVEQVLLISMYSKLSTFLSPIIFVPVS